MTREDMCARHCGLASCRLQTCIIFDPQPAEGN